MNKLTVGEVNFLFKYFPDIPISSEEHYIITTWTGIKMNLNLLGRSIYDWIQELENLINDFYKFRKENREEKLIDYKVKSYNGLIKIFDRGRYLFMKLYPEYSEIVH